MGITASSARHANRVSNEHKDEPSNDEFSQSHTTSMFASPEGIDASRSARLDDVTPTNSRLAPTRSSLPTARTSAAAAEPPRLTASLTPRLQRSPVLSADRGSWTSPRQTHAIDIFVPQQSPTSQPLARSSLIDTALRASAVIEEDLPDYESDEQPPPDVYMTDYIRRLESQALDHDEILAYEQRQHDITRDELQWEQTRRIMAEQQVAALERVLDGGGYYHDRQPRGIPIGDYVPVIERSQSVIEPGAPKMPKTPRRAVSSGRGTPIYNPPFGDYRETSSLEAVLRDDRQRRQAMINDQDNNDEASDTSVQDEGNQDNFLSISSQKRKSSEFSSSPPKRVRISDPVAAPVTRRHRPTAAELNDAAAIALEALQPSEEPGSSPLRCSSWSPSTGRDIDERRTPSPRVTRSMSTRRGIRYPDLFDLD